MAEKGDLPADNVSLPPTYAPSETYTESPPPAYRRDKSSRVAIVRMVCVTVVASALIIGFFILTSNYLNARSCNCGQDVLASKTLQTAGIVDLPRAGALVGLANDKPEDDKADDKLLANEQLENNAMKEVDTNDLDSGDEEVPPEANNDQVVIDTIPITEEEVKAAAKRVEEEEDAQRELEEVARMEAQMEEEEEALQDIMRAQMDHMKKIRLPVDLILGNPALAGRDVDCQVERRQQPLGGGIMSQAIIVTCSDDHEDQGPPRGPPAGVPGRQGGPPLSLLAPIMKMLSARAAASRVNQRLVPLNSPRPMPLPMGPMPCPGPFPCIMSRSKQMAPPMAGPFSGPMPMGGPKNRPMLTPLNGPPPPPQPKMNDGPRNRMLPFPFRPIVRMTPRLMTPPQRKEAPPMSVASLHRGALPLPPRPEVRKMIQHLVPEARGRALPDPVNLPGIRMLPGRLLAPAPSGAVERVGGGKDLRPITHMEMRAPPKTKVHTGPRVVDFGPPRVHTVIRPNLPISPPKIQEQAAASPIIITHPRPQVLPHDVHNSPIPKDIMTPPRPIAVISKTLPIAGPQTTVAPPPPKFDPNGRSGIVPEINPDAEMVKKPQGLPQHLSHPQGIPQHLPHPQGLPQHLPHPQGLPQHLPHPQGLPQHLPHPQGLPQHLPHPQGLPQHLPHPQGLPQHLPHPQGLPQHLPKPQGLPQDSPQSQGPPQDPPQPQGSQEERKHHLLLVN